MQTLITRTTSKGDALEIIIKDHDLHGYVNGKGGRDSIETLPEHMTIGTTTVAGFLRKSKIALTPQELHSVKAQVKAENAARLNTMRRAMRAPISRNQPTDLGDEMEREDSAF